MNGDFLRHSTLKSAIAYLHFRPIYSIFAVATAILSASTQYRLCRADGEYHWVLDRGVPQSTPKGEFAGYIGSCIDISDRIASESGLRARAEELSYITTVLAQTNELAARASPPHGSLINGLLQYCRAGRVETPKSLVSVGDLLG